MGITLAAAGCGSSDSGNPTTGGPGGYNAGIGVVGVTANGGYTVTFNGTGSYDSGVRIEGTNYPTTQSYGAGTLSFGTPILPLGQGVAGNIIGQSPYGSQLMLNAQLQTGAPGTANISGALTISPQTVSMYGQISSLQYIWIDAYPNGVNMGFQAAVCCTTQGGWLYVQ